MHGRLGYIPSLANFYCRQVVTTRHALVQNRVFQFQWVYVLRRIRAGERGSCQRLGVLIRIAAHAGYLEAACVNLRFVLVVLGYI